MTQVLEQKTKRKKQWQQILDAAKEALEKNDNTKKGIIRKTAELLENNGMPLEMICGAISRELREFASGKYIRDCLDDKYKNPVMNRAQIAEVTTANDDKNVLAPTGNVTLPVDSKSVTDDEQEGEGSSANVAELSALEESVTNVAQSRNEADVSEPSTKADSNETIESEKEPEEDFQIRPEDYIIADLPKYSSQLKDRIIIYLDEEVREPRRFKLEVESHE